MKVKVHDIKGEGLEFKETVMPNKIGLADEKVFKCLTPLEITGKLEKTGKAIIGKALVKGKFEFVCARCSEPIQQERSGQVDFYFEIDPTIEYIDLDEDIRQEMLIESLTIVVCSQDCKGVCPGCGANLNNEECKCHK